MKIFFDTANIVQIRQAQGWGVVDGVTTNPTLVAKEKRPFRETIREICGGRRSRQRGDGVPGGRRHRRRGQDSRKIHDRVVVKVPVMKEGLKATRALAAEGIRVNMTLVFSPAQVLLAAKAGAAFISPFVGRWTTPATRGWKSSSSRWRSCTITTTPRKSSLPASARRCTSCRLPPRCTHRDGAFRGARADLPPSADRCRDREVPGGRPKDPACQGVGPGGHAGSDLRICCGRCGHEFEQSSAAPRSR